MKAMVDGAGGERWLAMIERLTEGTAGGRKVVGPDKALNNGDVIDIGDTSFRIHHTGPAHTDNDIMIEVVDQKVLFTGDVVRNGALGLMESDASFKGNIAAIDWMVQKKFKHYLPGHGRAGGIEIVQAYRTYLDKLLTTVKKLYTENLSDHEMKPKVLEAVAAYKGWDGFESMVGPHVSRAYLEVEAEAF
jgi:glyoxylase-like metal-dependent hydrolase (beta-lactamase superfamily II)